MSKGGSTTTTQVNTLDPGTQRYVDQYRQMAMQAANSAMAGRGPLTAGAGAASREAGGLFSAAGRGYGDLAQRNLDFASGPLSGMDLSGYMNPYESRVIGGVQDDFDRQRQLATQRAGDLATAGGAFGGSRSAILEAQGLRDINQLEGQQIAGLRYSGFTNAQDRAFADRQMSANLGMAGLQGQLGAGQGLLGLDAYRQAIASQQNMDPFTRQQLALQFGGAGLNTPYGTTSTSTQEQSGNLFNSILGGGLALGGLGAFGPLGGIAGDALFGITGMGGNL